MSLKILFERYAKITEELAANREKQALLISKDVYALVSSRLQNRGLNSDGGKFKDYTKRYALLRRSLGLPTGIRTHTKTGEMLRTTRPIITFHDKEKTIVEIKAQNGFNQLKLNANSKIVKSNILGLSKDEKDLLSELNKERVFNIISSNTKK